MDDQDLLPIPRIETATEPVHSPADLRQRWRALMGPLGFGERLLWFGFIGPDRRFIKTLSDMPIGPRPESRVIKNLMSALRTLLSDTLPAGTTVALLLTGPGQRANSSNDRAWAEQLAAIAAEFNVPLQPVFCADDDVLLQLDGRRPRTADPAAGRRCARRMAAVSEARAVYVGNDATLEQVAAAIRAWQAQTGDDTEFAVVADSDGYVGMGFVIDVYAANDAEQLAARDRIAAGIRPLLHAIPVATDSDLDQRVTTSTDKR